MTFWAQNVEKKNIKIGSLLVSENIPLIWYNYFRSCDTYTEKFVSLSVYFVTSLWQLSLSHLSLWQSFCQRIVTFLSMWQTSEIWQTHTFVHTHTHMYTHTHTHAHIPALFQRYSMDVYLRFKIGSNKCCVVTICNWSHSHAHIIHTHDYTHTHTYWHTHIHPHWYTHMHWYTNTHKMY